MSASDTGSRKTGPIRCRFRPTVRHPIPSSSNASTGNIPRAALVGQQPPVVSSQSQSAQATPATTHNTPAFAQALQGGATTQELHVQNQRELKALRVQVASLQKQYQGKCPSVPIKGKVTTVSTAVQTSPPLEEIGASSKCNQTPTIILPNGPITQDNCLKPLIIVKSGGLHPLDPKFYRPPPLPTPTQGFGRGRFPPPIIQRPQFGQRAPAAPGSNLQIRFGQTTVNVPPRFGGGVARLAAPPAAHLHEAAGLAAQAPTAAQGAAPLNIIHIPSSDSESDWDI